MAAREPVWRSNLLVHPRRWGNVFLAAFAVVGLAACDGEQLYDTVGPDQDVTGGPTGPADLAVVVEVAAPDRIELTDSIWIGWWHGTPMRPPPLRPSGSGR